MFTSFEQYMKEVIQPMRDELTNMGIEELRTPDQVVELMDTKALSGTTLIVVNSVCGCAAGQARPGVRKALENEKRPDHLFTVFAGQDKEATAKAREYFIPYPPSSPSVALLKDGKLVHMIERHQIEDRSAGDIAADLIQAFEQHCG